MVSYELLSYAPYALAIVIGIGAATYFLHAPLARLLGRGQRTLERIAEDAGDAYHEEVTPSSPKEDIIHE